MGRDQPGDTADRVTDGTCEPSGASLARPLTRRQLLAAGSLGAVALFLGEACGTAPVPSTPGSARPLATPPPSVTTVTALPVTPTPTPTDTSPPDAMLQSAVASYAKAMGVPANAVQLTSRIITDVSGATLTALVAHDGTPLLLRDTKAGWIEATLAPLATNAGFILETVMQVTRQESGTWVDLTRNTAYVGLITENANHLSVSGELDMGWVFGRFTRTDWDRVLADWPAVRRQLASEGLPQPYPYDWVGIDRLVRFAAVNNLQLRATHLIFGDDIPSSITGYGVADLKRLLEFTVRARLVKCPSIQVWDIGDEILTRGLYLRDNVGGLWPQTFGAPEIVAFVGKLVREHAPKATLVVTEDMALEATFPDPAFSDWYLAYLRQIQDFGIEIGWADIENNFWVYDPPDPAKIDRVLGQIKALGIKTITSEMTVTVAPLYPNWPSRPKTIASVKDPLAAQAKLYGETLAAYLRHRTGAFGTGGVWDEIAWQNYIGHPEAHAMIYDTSGNAKPADYALRRQLLAGLAQGS